MQPKAGKKCSLGAQMGTTASRVASEPTAHDGTLHSTPSQSMAYRDSAGTRPWASGALVWKWWQGGDSYDSGADSSPS